MTRKFVVLKCAIVASMVISVVGAAAQEFGCTSRVIEETVKKSVARQLGPSPEAILQSIATIGREPTVTVQVGDIRETGSSPEGPSCTATVTVWREDTQETFGAVMQFTIIGNAIRTTSLVRQ